MGNKVTLTGSFWATKLAKGEIQKTDLTPRARRLVVQYLLHEGKYTKTEIGEMVGCHRNQVHNIQNKLRRFAAQALDIIDQREVAIELITTAEVVCARLMRNGKDAEAWKVKKELVESLQSLGFISKEPIKIDANLRLSLREVLELAAGNQAADFAADIQNGFHGGEIHQNGSHPSLPDSPSA